MNYSYAIDWERQKIKDYLKSIREACLYLQGEELRKQQLFYQHELKRLSEENEL